MQVLILKLTDSVWVQVGIFFRNLWLLCSCMHMCAPLTSILHNVMVSGYSQAKAVVESQRKVMMYKETVCTVGTVQYDWETALNKDHSVTERFFYAVKNLPINYRQKDYEEFLDNYGTVSGYWQLSANNLVLHVIGGNFIHLSALYYRS